MSLALVDEFHRRTINEWRQEICSAIGERGSLHRYERKHVLFHQDMPSDTVYGIKSGLVEISGLNAFGHEMTTSIRGPGQQFGWAEGLLGEPRNRQATVLQDAELWQMGIGDFLDMLVEKPRIMLAALGSAVHREQRSAVMRYDLRGTNAFTRVGYILRQLALSVDAGNAAGAPVLRITHEEISRLCELSRQTVTTILGEMQRDGILELGLRSIRVIDRHWLAEVPSH